MVIVELHCGKSHPPTADAVCIVCFQPFDIGDDYCGQHDINHPIVGSVPLSRDAAVTWPDVTATSLAVAVTTAGYTVAFVAMDDGTARKVRLSRANKINIYERLSQCLILLLRHLRRRRGCGHA